MSEQLETTEANGCSSEETDLSPGARQEIGTALEGLLADVFAIYLKTKNFHWHVSGPHFRDYHLLLDEHGNQLFSMTDQIAERSRKLGTTTIRSIGHIALMQRIADNDAGFVAAHNMLSELRGDNLHLTSTMRQIHRTCDAHQDIATASLLENWIDEAERRTWFLCETLRTSSPQGGA
jgi:starvation-inducible DNA-binding protein